MGIFKNAFNRVKGLVTGGSEKAENISKKEEIKSKGDLTISEINHLHNHNVMMNKRVALRRLRNKMRRATQQSQRS
jgi:hypothetical protein